MSLSSSAVAIIVNCAPTGRVSEFTGTGLLILFGLFSGTGKLQDIKVAVPAPAAASLYKVFSLFGHPDV